MNGSRLTFATTILIAVASFSCDRNSPEHQMKEARNALVAKGMTVGVFAKMNNYPGATQGREQVQCATVSRNDGDGRLCLVFYNDIDVTIRAANLKFRAGLPEGSLYLVRGKSIWVIEPGPRSSATLVQDAYDDLRASVTGE